MPAPVPFAGRDFCHACHRPVVTCFCAFTVPFETSARFALIVHPHEARSTVGTAWILRRSISNLAWVRSNGRGLDDDAAFRALLRTPGTVPLLLYPGPRALDLGHAPETEWRALLPVPTPESALSGAPSALQPLFIVIDGTWTHAQKMLSRSSALRALPRVSFETIRLSEYGFKLQPHPDCLSSVESVHRVIELLAERGWSAPPAAREHDRMIEIFRSMVRFQMERERDPATGQPLIRRRHAGPGAP